MLCIVEFEAPSNGLDLGRGRGGRQFCAVLVAGKSEVVHCFVQAMGMTSPEHLMKALILFASFESTKSSIYSHSQMYFRDFYTY